MDILETKPTLNKHPSFNILVLGPGGIKGYIELGAVFGLERNGVLNDVKIFIGVSVGAIISLFINIGISTRDILYLAIDDVKIIDLDKDFNFIELVKNMNTNLGIFSLSHIKEILIKTVVGKLGYIPTMKELHLLTEKELNIVVFNLSECKTEYISYINYPDLSCVDAVLLSINIPIIFWRMTLNNSVYIDGAFGDPYPVLLYDNGENNILGICVRTNTDDKSYKSPLLYLHDVIHCLFNLITTRNMRESSDKCVHIELDNNILDTIGTSLTIDDKAKMFLAGLQIVRDHFGGSGI